jgi:Uncharacterised nucleotidyltransferase
MTSDVAQRLRRFRRSWHAGDLWPDVTEAAFLAAMSEIARVTTALAGASSGRAALHPRADLPALGAAAYVAGMGPLLGFWIERGRLDAPPDVAALLARHLDQGRRRAARLAARLERVLAALGVEGVTPVILKGMHTAWGYFPEPGTRTMADLDLLVDEAALPAARRALATLELTPVSTVRGRITWRPPGDHVPRSLEMTHADDPWELDLHVSLDRWFSDTVPARLGPVESGDVAPLEHGPPGARGLAQPLLTALLALHLSDHFEMTTLVRLVELSWVIRRDLGTGTREWGALLARLRTTGASAFVYPAFELTEKLLPGTVDPAFRASIRDDAPAAVRRAVDPIEPAGAMRMYDRSLEIRVMWLDGWRSRLAWLAWRLWPRVGDVFASPPAAARLAAGKLWRVITGRMRWTRTR